MAFQLRAPVLSASYTLAYTYAPRDQGMAWTYVEGSLDDLSGAYELAPGGGGTLVTYRLAVEPGVPVPGLLKRQAARQVARSARADLKRRVESG